MHLPRVRIKCFCCTLKACSACKFPLEAQSVFGGQNYYLLETSLAHQHSVPLLQAEGEKEKEEGEKTLKN